MSKRVSQLEIFLAGFRDASDNPANGHIVKFYDPDQTYTNLKNAWTSKDKDAIITSVTLDSSGRYTTGAYFAGGEVYDLRLFESDGTTVVRSYDDVKVPETTTSIRTVTAASVTATIDDDVILCDTDSNPITVNLYPAADSIKSITIKNIGSSGNAVTVDGSGTELIDGSTTDSILSGLAQTYYSDLTQWFSVTPKSQGGAFLTTSGGDSIPSSASGAVMASWSTGANDNYDDGGWFSSGAPSRLTVPSGVTRVQVGCNIKWEYNSASYRIVAIQLNASIVSRFIQAPISAGGVGPESVIVTPPIDVSPGQYLEVLAAQESGSALSVTGDFWIRAV
jgi:hypothetical protein